jgi:NTE family protein
MRTDGKARSCMGATTPDPPGRPRSLRSPEPEAVVPPPIRGPADPSRPTTQAPRPAAFVLSSGANLGAVQVGVLRALVEHGIRPDLIVGCSIGAINGAALAEDPTMAGVARLEHVWTTTDTRTLMPRPWLPPPVALMRRGEAIHSRAGLHRLLDRVLTATCFSDLDTPLHCVATDVHAGAEAWFHEGPLIEALLASSAMPAMFPSVVIDGRRYLDGAVVNDVPVRRAVELGARTLYVLEVGPLSRAWSESSRPLGTAIEAYWIARRYRFQRELDALPPEVEVHLMPHGDPPRLRVNDFTRSAELIAAAHRASTDYLARVSQIEAPA